MLQTTAAEVAAAEERAKAALAEAAAAAAKAFPKGTKVTATWAHADFPKGAVGTVQGPAPDPGSVEVKFPKGTHHLAASDLRRA